MTVLQRYQESFGRIFGTGQNSLGTAAVEEVRGLADPGNLAIAALFIGAQFTPVGWAADVAGLAPLSADAGQGLGALIFGPLAARTDEDFDESANVGSHALAQGSIQVGLFLGGKAAGKGLEWLKPGEKPGLATESAPHTSLPKPTKIDNGAVRNFIAGLYSKAGKSAGEGRVGTGSLADYVRSSGTHLQKAQDAIRYLEKQIASGRLTPNDVNVAKAVLQDLPHAIQNAPVN